MRVSERGKNGGRDRKSFRGRCKKERNNESEERGKRGERWMD